MVQSDSASGKSGIRLVRPPAVRIGLVIGVASSLVLVAWVFLANRVPSLESFAMERNVAAESVLGLLVLIPVVVFFRQPVRLLISGLATWSVLSFTYWLLALYFASLSERWSTFQVVAKGFLGYLIAMVLTWVVSTLQRVRRSRGPRASSILAEHHVPRSDSAARLS